jgi:hypothetical protein
MVDVPGTAVLPLSQWHTTARCGTRCLASFRTPAGPGCQETRENLKEAIRLVLKANRELARRGTQGHDVVRESIVVSL